MPIQRAEDSTAMGDLTGAAQQGTDTNMLRFMIDHLGSACDILRHQRGRGRYLDVSKRGID